MFIHIGNDNVIRSRNIVSIIDYDVVTSSTIMEEMMEAKTKEKNVIGPVADAKSVVITGDKTYYSTLSVSTLEKRSSIQSMLQKFKDYSNDEEHEKVLKE